MGIKKDKKELFSRIRKANTIFLMAHDNLDLDALGSTIGLYVICQKKRKKCYIIIDEKSHEDGVNKVLKELTGCLDIIKSSEIEEKMHPRQNKNLLVILDVNKEEIVQSKKALELIDNKVILDHHNTGKTTIKDAYKIIDEDVSSTCEMISNMVEAYDIELDPYYATVLLAGIVLDTNNFTLKTSANTYYSAYYLSCLGASAQKVQYLLKQNIEEYTKREKMLSDIETVKNKIAITKSNPHTINRREDLAKVADTLLFFNNIEASFVVGRISKNEIGISARSLGDYDINKVLNEFNGGGDDFHGAATVEGTVISPVITKLKKILEEDED